MQKLIMWVGVGVGILLSYSTFANMFQQEVQDYYEQWAGHDVSDPTLNHYSEIIKSNIYSATAYYNRGLVYARMGFKWEAINDYSIAILLDPTLAPAYYNRSLLYAQQGHLEVAIEDYQKAMGLEHHLRVINYNRPLPVKTSLPAFASLKECFDNGYICVKSGSTP